MHWRSSLFKWQKLKSHTLERKSHFDMKSWDPNINFTIQPTAMTSMPLLLTQTKSYLVRLKIPQKILTSLDNTMLNVIFLHHIWWQTMGYHPRQQHLSQYLQQSLNTLAHLVSSKLPSFHPNPKCPTITFDFLTGHSQQNNKYPGSLCHFYKHDCSQLSTWIDNQPIRENLTAAVAVTQ